MIRVKGFALCCLLFLASSGIVNAQSGDSQILTAYNADLVVIGEVVYLGKPHPIITTAAHLNHQLAVFRVAEVLKGKYRGPLIKIKFVFGIDTNGLRESDFGRGNRFILLLEQSVNAESCKEVSGDWKFEQTQASLRYLKVPCYRSFRSAAIAATSEEVKAVKWMFEAKKPGSVGPRH